MTQYDNEFFRGPPEGSPTLVTDQRPTGAEVFQSKPEKTTAVADVPVTREEVPKDPPKKKSNARRITKAIKLLASCMAAVVITEAATNIAATIEPPPEVPTGLYYEGQWPGVRMAEDTWLVTDMDAVEGNIIQAYLEGKAWRFYAQRDWRMLWLDRNLFIENLSTGIKGRLNMDMQPYMFVEAEAVYGEVTASTGETLYFRGFLEGGGSGTAGESLELQQAAMDEFIAGLTVTPATDDGWQGVQIGDKLYSQQSEDWYGFGGYGDLEIDILWVCDSEDYDLQNKTPYSRVNVNGITWSIYFAENDTYLWAVPNIDPEICLGGYVSRFMCADAVRRGEYISDDEWLEMGGFTSASQRQTAVDILIECLQHHYALRDRWYPRDWPWKGATETASYWVWAESVKGKWIQFSFGDESYRVDSTDPELRFHWERTSGSGNDRYADLEISRLSQNEELWAVDVTVRRTAFPYTDDAAADIAVRATGGETLYLRFESLYHGNNPDFTPIELADLAKQIVDTLTFHSNPDDSGWSTMLLCDTMHSPQTMEWSGSGIVGSANEIRYIHLVEEEGLQNETPRATRTHNGITWSLYLAMVGDDEIIWAVPDIEPDVCIGFEAINAVNYYREKYTDLPTYGWRDDFKLSADDVNPAVEAVSEALSHVYPLGVEPEESIYPEWPQIYAVAEDASFGFAMVSERGTSIQFSFGDRAYRITSDNPALRFHWDCTQEWLDVKTARLNISYVEGDGERWGLAMAIQRAPFPAEDDVENGYYAEMPNTDGEMMYLRFNSYWSGDGLIHSEEEMEQIVGAFLSAIQIEPDPDDSGWGKLLICETMHTRQSMNWSGHGMVRDSYGIDYFHTMEYEGLVDEVPCDVRTINGITWSFFYDAEDEIIWAQPNIEPDVCLGGWTLNMQNYYRQQNPGMVTDGWNDRYNVPADDVNHAVEGLAEGLSYIYPLGVEPEKTEEPVEGGYDPVKTVTETPNPVQISLGHRGYRLYSTTDGTWLDWLVTREHSGALAAEMNVGSGFAAIVYIAEMPLAEYDDRSHGQIPVDNGETLYWYGMELYGVDEMQMADFMGRITASEAAPGAWGRILIEDSVYSQQGLGWSGWETVDPDGGRTVMMWNLERTKDMELGDPVAQREINGILWTLYVMEEYSEVRWPFIWAVPDIDPEIAIGSDYENAVYKYYEDHGLIEDFDGDLWTAESMDGAAEMIFEVLYNYYPQ